MVVTRLGPLRVRLAVVDRSRIHPAPRTATVSDESGRGLLVLDTVAECWGTEPVNGGKRVWAELCLSAEYTVVTEAGTP